MSLSESARNSSEPQRPSSSKKLTKRRSIDESGEPVLKTSKMDESFEDEGPDEQMNYEASSSYQQENFKHTKPGNNGEVEKKKIVIRGFKAKKNTNREFDSWESIDELAHAILFDRMSTLSNEGLFSMVKTACEKQLGNAVYERVTQIILKYNQELRTALDSDAFLIITESNSDLFIATFAKLWQDYPAKMHLIRNVFLVMDRDLVNSVTDSEVMPLWDKSMWIFRKIFFPELETDVEFRSIKLFTAIFITLQKMMKNHTVERQAMKMLLGMISTIHMTEEFAQFLLTEIRAYYQQQRIEILPQSTCKEYSRYSYEQIEKYTNIVQSHFDDNSMMRDINRTVLNCLIAQALPEFLTHDFDGLIESDDISDVHKMFSLCAKCPGGEEAVRAQFIKYIKAKGQKLMNSCQDDDLFAELCSFKKKIDQVMKEGFSASADITKFQQSLRDSFEVFMNCDQNRAASLISKHFHGILRTCNKKATDESLDEMIDEAIDLFRFIRGKDIFEAFYKRGLSKRLLMERSASVDAEKMVLTKLKTECGQEFTQHLEGMFKDMETSEDIQRSFMQYLEHQNKEKVNFSVKVLSHEHWPKCEEPEISIPKEMQDNLIDFKEFYKTQYSTRGVKWIYTQCSASLSAEFRPNYKKELQCTLHQAVILLLFNKCEKWTIKEIVDCTKIEKIEIIKNVLALNGGRGKPRIIRKFVADKDMGDKKSGEVSIETIENDEFVVNTALEEKVFRIRIPQVQIKTPKEEEKEVEQQVNHDRIYQCDAAVVRIMKARKELAHSALIQEIMAQLKFPVKSADIKLRIESLIERDYLVRDTDEPNKYKYVA